MPEYFDKKRYRNLYFTYYNLGQNIWGLFHVLAQFLFLISETELDYYHKKVRVWFVKWLKKFQENPWNAWIWWRVTSRPPKKTNFDVFWLKNAKKPAVKHSTEKPIKLGPGLLIFYFLQILVFQKSHSLFKFMFRATHMQQRPKYDIIQKTLFCALSR